MSEIARIRDQLERAHRGSAWHGPSLREILVGVDSDTASSRPIPNGHTIRELVVHVTAWENEAVARLRGGASPDMPPERDWPEGAEGKRAWEALVGELDRSHERLMSAIGELDDDSLDQLVTGHPTSIYHLLHGVIQHNLYHAGQMVLLKKAT